MQTAANPTQGLNFFEKYLTLWVLFCIAAGVLLGRVVPAVPEYLKKLEYAQVSIPIAILIWLMIFPLMLKIDFSSLLGSAKKPKGLTITVVTNWLIKPFSMYGIAFLFLKLYLPG